MSETLDHLAVPAFGCDESLVQAMHAKANFINEDLYPRDGSRALGEVQAELAQLVGVEEDQVLAYASGMAATTAAIDIGIHVSQKSRPVVAVAQETYSQTKRYAQNFLSPFRAKVIYFDAGDTNSVEDVLTRPDIDVIELETVGNSQNMPVLDIEHFLHTFRQLTKRPTTVIDTTTTLSTGYELGKELTVDDEIIGVESGTKAYTFNKAMFGIGFTKNPLLFDALRRYRRTRGDLPSTESQAKILSLLPQNREQFDERNQSTSRAAGIVGVKLADRALQTKSDDLIIAHPAIPTHPNARVFSEQYRSSGAPFVYVSATPKSELTQYDLLKRLTSSDEVMKHAERGQSFGFDNGRIIYDENLPMIRIAAGAKTDAKAFGAACADALFL